MSAKAPAQHPVAQTLALLQPWIEFVPRQRRRLGLFICLAIAIHVTAFFFIRIDATRAELQPPARTHVTIETIHPAAGVETSDAYLDRLTDPRLFLLPALPLSRVAAAEAAPALPAVNSRFDTPVLPAAASAGNFPLAHETAPSLQEQVAAGMQPARQTFTYDEAPIPAPTKTTWQWDPDLAGRAPLAFPNLPSPVSDSEINATELRVAIDASGTVQHVLLEETCQKPELDQQAILAARKLRFPPTTEPGQLWGRLTIFWHCTAPPRDVVVPTP